MIFTHTPITMALYSLGAREIGRNDLLILAFFSMFPDLDHFLPASFDASRVFLHNLPVLLIMLAISFPVSRRLCAQIAAGTGSHILIDLADGGGIALFFPFSRSRFSLKLWHAPEPEFIITRGLPLDFTLAFASLAVMLAVAFWKRKKDG